MNLARFIKLSSKGQVVIPVDIRRRFGLDPGSRLRLEVQGDDIVLKPADDRDWQEFRGVLDEEPSLTEALEEERRKDRDREP